ncbi:MAG: RNA polymerase sigma factor [Myxococcota bacterium]
MGVRADAERTVRDVFDAHVHDVWRTIHFLGVPEHDVADVCQDVFLVVHRRLHTFEGRSALTSWLYGICVRTVSAYRRKAFRRHERLVDELPAESTDAPQERRYLANEKLTRLRALLEALDEKQRAVFVLYEIENLSMKEIAAGLEIPVQTAYSRLRVARRLVREGFEAQGGAP